MADRNEQKTIRDDFGGAVDMTPKQLEDWLAAKESKASGQGSDKGESTRHESGRMIVALRQEGRRTDG